MTNWVDKDKSLIWHPFAPLKGQAEPLPVKSASGCTIQLEDGSTLIDAISSWWVNPLGHAHPEIAKAAYDQMLKVEHVIFAGFTHEPAVTLAEKLIRLNQHPFSKVFFSDNGSTSVEVALKLAVQYFHNLGQPRTKIVSFENAYHGDTFGAMAVGQKGTFFEAFEDMVFEVEQIPIPTKENIEQVGSQLEEILVNKDVAAFIFEPLLQGAGGMNMYRPEHLDQLISIAKKHNTICIADEVMTGFGRTGTLFACDQLQEAPDLMCLSKCLTGGFIPLSVTLINEKIKSAFDNDQTAKAFYHGHSYTGNPVGCAIANKAVDLISSEETKNNWQRIASNHKSFAAELEQHPKTENIRILGTVLAFEVKDETQGYFSNIKHQLKTSFFSNGVLLRPLGNTVYIMPPFVITNEELAQVYSAITKALETI